MEPILNRAEALEIRMGYEPSWLGQALEVYNRTEMKRPNRDQVHLAFSNSQVVATVWKNDRLIAVGRAISDFKMYSGIYDLAVDPEFQKIGIGRKLMTKLLEPLQGTCVFLTSTFGNEEFYQRLGFRFHKSALALYPERMQTTPYLYKNYSISSGLVEKNEIRFSLATKSDWKGSYLLNESLGYVTTETGFHKRFEILLAHPDHEVVVAKKKSEIVGWMHLNVRHVLEAENFAQLAGLVVRETERNNGIGAQFLKIAEHWAKAQGYMEVLLYSNVTRERAHKFYLRNGYSQIKTSKLFKKILDP